MVKRQERIQRQAKRREEPAEAEALDTPDSERREELDAQVAELLARIDEITR